MVEKPITADEEQRRQQTRAARFQSGLPVEEEEGTGDTGSGESPQEQAEQRPAEPVQDRP